MGKRIKITKSKNSMSYFVIQDYTNPKNGKRSTYIVEKLGNLDSLKQKFNTDSPDVVWQNLQDYLTEIKNKDKEENSLITLNLSPDHLIDKNNNRLFNLGYIYPRNILFSLGIKNICSQIKSRHKFKFDLTSILVDLICARIIFPGSKRSSYKDSHHFLEFPQYSLQNVYRSLPILAQERYFIESELYKNSDQIYNRNTAVLFYDCTNFYFEIEEEYGFCTYGKSKENRPNPIVQYGLFMDSDGIPIADYIFEGKSNEQFSLRELEKRIENDFKFSKFIVCADAGLNGWENKIYNDKKSDGAFIVTQPIKKLKKNLREWVIEPEGWKVLNHSGTYDISKLDSTIVIDGITMNTSEVVFYKDRWEKTTKKTSTLDDRKYTLEEHLIVTFNTKFQKYQRHIRNKKLERAEKMLDNPGKIKTNNQRDPKYFIKETTTTKEGEIAKEKHYEIDYEKVNEEMKYDGFYGVTTDLEDKDLSMIIKANKQRWEIEENFEIMKSEFKTRPMYVTEQESIEGHLLTCFIALLVYRIFEKKYMAEKYTNEELISTLRELNITHIGGENYIPSFTRTEIVDQLAETFGFQPSREIITQKYLKKFLRVAKSRKSTKIKTS